MRPPMTMVCLSLIMIVVLAVRLSVVGSPTWDSSWTIVETSWLTFSRTKRSVLIDGVMVRMTPTSRYSYVV